MKKNLVKSSLIIAALFLVTFGQASIFLRSDKAAAAGITGAFFASHTNILLVSGSGFGATQGASTVSVDGTSLGVASSWSDSDIYYSAPAKNSGTLSVSIDGGGNYSATISLLSTYTPYPSDPDISNSNLVAYYPFDGDFKDKKSSIDLDSFHQRLYGSGKFNGKYESLHPLFNPTANINSGAKVLRIGSQLLLYWTDDVAKYSISSDEGVTWSDPVAAPTATYGMPQQMDNGQWLYLRRGGWPATSFDYCHASNVTVDNVFNPPDLACVNIDATAYTAMSGGWGDFYTQWSFIVQSGGRIIWPVYRYFDNFGSAMLYSEDYGQTWGFKPMSQKNVISGLTLTVAVTAGDTTIAVSDASQLTDSGVVKLTKAGTNETVSYGGKSGNTLTNVRKGNGGQFLVGSELNAQSVGTTNSYAIIGTTVMQNFATPGEPSVVVDPNNANHLILFERHEGGAGSYVLKAESTDFGDTWSQYRTIYIGGYATGEPVRANNLFAYWTANAGGVGGRIYIFGRHWAGTKYFYSDDSGASWLGSNAMASTKADNNYTIRIGNTWDLANDMDQTFFIESADKTGLIMHWKWAIDNDTSPPGTGTSRVVPMANMFFSYADSTSGKNLNYAKAAYDARFNLGTYSLDFWANLPETHRNIDGTIISRTSSDGAQANYDVKIIGNGVNQNKVQFRQYNDLTSSWNTIYSSAALSVGTWYHVVASYDGSTMRLYMNGTLDSQTASTSTHSGTETLQIGYDAGNDSLIYRGQLDNLKIWDRALLSSEVLVRSNWALPTITSVSPTSLYAGDTLAIIGSGFGASQGQNSVVINNQSVNVISWSDTEISVIVPASLSSGLYNVMVSVGGFDSNTATVSVLNNVLLPATGVPQFGL